MVELIESAEAAWCGVAGESRKGQREALQEYRRALRVAGDRDVGVLCSYAEFVQQHVAFQGLQEAELALQQVPYSPESCVVLLFVLCRSSCVCLLVRLRVIA